MVDIKYLGHASILISTDTRYIYVDPWKIVKEQPKADLILITHPHYDHFSPEDIRKIGKKETVIVGPSDIKKIKIGENREIKPNEEIVLDWIKIKGFPAYNLNKSFHPKSNNWLGFVLEIKGEKIYIAGDTDFIPEMKNLKVDIAIVPVGGTYTMNAKEASDAINTINPKIAIPYHWGDIVGSEEDVKLFSSSVLNAKVEILKIEK